MLLHVDRQRSITVTCDACWQKCKMSNLPKLQTKGCVFYASHGLAKKSGFIGEKCTLLGTFFRGFIGRASLSLNFLSYAAAWLILAGVFLARQYKLFQPRAISTKLFLPSHAPFQDQFTYTNSMFCLATLSWLLLRV